LHCRRVELAVCLSARTAHGWAFPAIKNPKLDAAEISGSAHEAIERIDFPHKVTLSEPANCRIAGHGADRGEPVRNQRSFGARPRSRGGSLAAGMAAANHHDVKSIIHENLGGRVLAKARGGVKSIANVFHVKHFSN